MALTKPRAYQIYDIDYKQATRVVSTTNVTLSGGAPNSVDGVNLSLNDRVLVVGQTSGAQNGIYYVTTLGSGSNGTWSRSIDTDTTGELEAGTIVMVTEGVTYADTQWKLITNNPITIGVTAITFAQISTGIVYTAATSPPATGNNKGDQWYNTATDILYEYQYDGTSFYWVDVSSTAVAANAILSYATINDPTFTGNVAFKETSVSSTNRALVDATGFTMGVALKEAQTVLSGTSIDLTLSNYFSRTNSGITSFTVANVPASGTAASFILDLTNGGSGAITWWGNVKWAGGTAPTLTVSGRDVLGFYTYDNGTTWTGLVLGKDVK